MPRKTPARVRDQPRHPAIILELEPHKYAVAVWHRDEDGEPVYEILHRDIREVKVAATLARTAEREAGRPWPSPVEEFIRLHRAHGQLVGDAAEPTLTGFRMTIECPCGVTFIRWVTAGEAAVDLTALVRRSWGPRSHAGPQHRELPAVDRAALHHRRRLHRLAELRWRRARGALALLTGLGVVVRRFEVRAVDDFDAAFAGMTQAHAEAVVMMPDPLTLRHRARIVALALQKRLPAVYGFGEFVRAGGLMAYGPSVPDLARRAATYVDKILKGAKSADLPVEQPTKFELVINLKTAKALGLTIPQSLLIRADEIIQWCGYRKLRSLFSTPIETLP